MPLGETDDNNMLDWEKLNAAEHLRKIKIAEQEKLDNRVVAIGDRCVQSGRNLYISDLVRNIGLLQNIVHHRFWFNQPILTHLGPILFGWIRHGLCLVLSD